LSSIAGFNTDAMHNLPTPSDQQVIWLQQSAPSKPAIGQACNGCGVCCAAAPCPVALVFLWQWRGACRALLWDAAQQMYRCGMVLQPQSFVRVFPIFLSSVFKKLIRRWIAADTVCDSSADATPSQRDT